MQSLLLAAGETRPLPPVHISAKQLVNYHQMALSAGWPLLVPKLFPQENESAMNNLNANAAVTADGWKDLATTAVAPFCITTDVTSPNKREFALLSTEWPSVPFPQEDLTAILDQI